MSYGVRFKNVFFILLGACILSFGIVHFNMQNNLSEGGFTGITLFLRKFNIKCSVIFYRLEVIRENRLFLYAYWNGQSFCFSLDFPAIPN